METKHMIWSDIALNYEDWRGDMEAEYPDMSEDERIALMHEINADYLDDERMNLNIQMPREIIIIGDLGLWNGRFSGYKMVDSGNIRDCLFSDCDYNEWYVDAKGDMRCTAIHHDGSNHYLYRAVRETATHDQLDRLKNLIYHGRATRWNIERVTERLGDKIGDVYGWTFPKVQRETAYER